MKATVIISTYNSEKWLEKVLWGYSCQAEKDFELIIADDGSTATTSQLVQRMRPLMGIPVIHVWQEDHGFRKTEILNKAILASNSDYLIFSDGDCIPRNDFVQQHLRNRKKGRFLSGGYFKLPLSLSESIGKSEILSQECFILSWLRLNGLHRQFKNLKLMVRGLCAAFMNLVTTTKPSWNGHNSSGWKDDLLAVNGFNQDMSYGGEDRELGERLERFGIFGKQIRYSAICVHLEHDQAYATQVAIARNTEIRRNNKRNNTIVVPNGLNKLGKDNDKPDVIVRTL